MDFKIGIEQMISGDTNYAEELAIALDTNNRTIKKHIFDLLCALSLYSQDGHWKALEALKNYQSLKKTGCRFQVIVEELKQTKNIEYKIVLLTFINCLIISSNNLKERKEIRNEFINLKLLDLFNLLKNEPCNEELKAQFGLFEDQKLADENILTPNMHQDLFYNILKQISGNSNYELFFLHILQHLLTIDYRNCKDNFDQASLVWETLERLVHRAIFQIKCKEDAEKLLKKLFKSKKNSFEVNAIKSNEYTTSVVYSPQTSQPLPLTTPDIKASNAITSFGTISLNSNLAPQPPPPPPLPPSTIPPPPPLPINLHSTSSNLNQSLLPFNTTESISEFNLDSSTSKASSNFEPTKFPHLEVPKPKSKMKSFNWIKVPFFKVVQSRKPNIWSIVATNSQSIKIQVDFETLEGLFCQPNNVPISLPNSCPGSPSLNRKVTLTLDNSTTCNSLEKIHVKKLSGEYNLSNINETNLNLLDGKKSLNVNIFLKQYRGSTDELLNLIKNGDHEKIGAERLRNLLKLIPEKSEAEMLNAHKHDINKMPIAEKFLAKLVQISNYKLRVECMLLKEELSSNLGSFEPLIYTIKTAAKEIQNNQDLHQVLYLILMTGNFLNSGGYAGDAVGFKIICLSKLAEIRSNKAGISLVHYVALEAQKKGCLSFLENLSSLEEASKISVALLKDEIKTISNKVSTIKVQIRNQTNQSLEETNFFQTMAQFLENGEKEIEKLSHLVNDEIEKIRMDLAAFFCEDEEHFKLEECFTLFYGFYQRFKLALEENEKRKDSKIKLEERRKIKSLENKKCVNLDYEQNGYEALSFQFRNQELITKSSNEDELHNGLMELLRTANKIGGNGEESMYGSLRRVGSGRRSRVKIDVATFNENSREREPHEKQYPVYKVKSLDLTLAKMSESVEKNEHEIKEKTGMLFLEIEKGIEDEKNCNNEKEQKEKKNCVKNKSLESKSFHKLSDNKVRLESEFPHSKNEQYSSKDNENKDHLRKDNSSRLWNCKETNKAFENSTTLFSKPIKQTQPLAIIAPTKVEKERVVDEKEIKVNVDINSLVKKRPSLLCQNNSQIAAAAYVTPVQLAERKFIFNSKTMVEEPTKARKSKLPIRKGLNGALLKPICNKSAIPIKHTNEAQKQQYHYYTSIHKNFGSVFLDKNGHQTAKSGLKNAFKDKTVNTNGETKNSPNYLESKSWMRQTKSSSQRIIFKTKHS